MKKIISSKIFSNFFHLGIYQIANLLFPLLISPYLISRVGLENFGLLVSTQALMTFFNIVCDYGFNMSATRDISLAGKDKNLVNNIFNAVIFIKILLVVLSFIILLLIVKVVPFFSDYFYLYLFSFCITIGRAFFPIWFFQGIQRMHYLIFFSFFSKGGAFILVMLLIKDANNLVLVNPIIGLMDLIGTFLLILYVKKKYKFSFKIPQKNVFFEHVKKGFYLFLSNFLANVCLSSNTVILGMFSSRTDLGIYSVVERIVFLMKQFPMMVFQASYPQACNLWTESKEAFLIFIKRLFLLLFFSTLVFSIAVYFFATTLSEVFSKDHLNEISLLLSVMCFLPIIGGINYPPYIILLLLNKTIISSQIIMIGSIITVTISFLSIQKFSYWGSVLSLSLADFFITVSFFIIAKNKWRTFFLKN